LADDIQRFVEMLFEFKDESHYILVWSLRDHRSAWFQDVREAVAYARTRSEQDLYVGAGLSSVDLGDYRRCTEGEVVAVAGFCCDADFASSEHQKANLPPQEDALRFLREMPLPPSVVTYTGHGYHGWWLFKEPWTIKTLEEQREAKWVSQQWTEILRSKVAAEGWTVDSVFDLSRVMRVPGTLNCKADKVRARIEEAGDWRAGSLEDFYRFIPEPQPDFMQPLSEVAAAGNLVLDPDAEPPFTKFQTLCVNVPRVLESFNHKSDVGDQSPSAWDLSLASYATMADWTDQEIVNLIIASRRQNGCDLKLRPDYYARTISVARRKTARGVALDNLETITKEDPDVYARLSDLLGVKIEKLIRYQTAQGGRYYLIASGRRLSLGHISNLIEQRAFTNALADTTGVVPIIPRKKWPPLRQLLRSLCQDEDLGENTSEAELISTWIEQYLDISVPSENPEDAMPQRLPFIKDGRVYISLTDFRRCIRFTLDERMDRIPLATAMRAAGLHNTRVEIRAGDKRLSQRVWAVPDELASKFIDVRKRVEQQLRLGA